MTIGERIKLARQHRGYTQEQLATKMGYKGKSIICKFEKNSENMTLDTVESFAKALDVSPSYLMGWEDVEWNAKTQEVVKVENPYNKIPNDAMFIDEKMNLLIDGMNSDEKFAEAVMDYVLKLTAKKIKKIQEKE